MARIFMVCAILPDLCRSPLPLSLLSLIFERSPLLVSLLYSDHLASMVRDKSRARIRLLCCIHCSLRLEFLLVLPHTQAGPTETF